MSLSSAQRLVLASYPQAELVQPLEKVLPPLSGALQAMVAKWSGRPCPPPPQDDTEIVVAYVHGHRRTFLVQSGKIVGESG